MTEKFNIWTAEDMEEIKTYDIKDLKDNDSVKKFIFDKYPDITLNTSNMETVCNRVIAELLYNNIIYYIVDDYTGTKRLINQGSLNEYKYRDCIINMNNRSIEDYKLNAFHILLYLREKTKKRLRINIMHSAEFHINLNKNELVALNDKLSMLKEKIFYPDINTILQWNDEKQQLTVYTMQPDFKWPVSWES
jgi:hypothetical protein